MPTNKHKITVNGKEYTRNSKTHEYTHALVALVKKTGEPIILGWTAQADTQKALNRHMSPWMLENYSDFCVVANEGSVKLPFGAKPCASECSPTSNVSSVATS